MPRGGYRPGAGGVSQWKKGKTKTIRVPEVLADKVIKLARILDEDGEIQLKGSVSEPVTESKVINLSKASITHVNGEMAIRLEELVRLGYVIKPKSLADMVEARIRRKYFK